MFKVKTESGLFEQSSRGTEEDIIVSTLLAKDLICSLRAGKEKGIMVRGDEAAPVQFVLEDVMGTAIPI